MTQKERKKKMSKNKKILMVLIIALVLSVLAGVGVFTLINSQKTTIYSFNGDFKAGTKITDSMFTPIQVDKKVVETNRNSDISNYYITASSFNKILNDGDYLRTNVSANEILCKSMLVTNSGNEIEASMQSDKVALTLSVDSITGVTSDIRAGSYVNIYCGEKNSTVPKSEIFEKMKILEVQQAADDANTLNSITVECTNVQSETLVSYAQNGYIYMGLINITGYQSTTTSTTPTSK